MNFARSQRLRTLCCLTYRHRGHKRGADQENGFAGEDIGPTPGADIALPEEDCRPRETFRCIADRPEERVVKSAGMVDESVGQLPQPGIRAGPFVLPLRRKNRAQQRTMSARFARKASACFYLHRPVT